ncbi:NAD(P)/FAD-dependent oxidoreductase [Psychrobacter namhaensis]|uniref:NAD(P)/FAD-dependent oxidoreductase n=1 Tax=Psychrobacter namhaensis TaxID=292734 RepID=UPI003D030624
MLLHTSKTAAKSAIDTDSPDVPIHQIATDHTYECSKDEYGHDKYSADEYSTDAQKNNYCHDKMGSEGVIIIGAGMAGSRFAIELARVQQQSIQAKNERLDNLHLKSPDRPLPITLIGKEPQVGYNRIMLSPVLSGDAAFEDTYLYDKADYEALGITVLAGLSVDTIDTEQQSIELSNGQVLRYAKLVIATGSTARVIPLPNHTAKGVHVFRDVADVTALTEYARQGKTGLVIGGGVLGLEAACAMSMQGASMTVIHVDDYVLNRQLDLPAAQLLQAELSRRGVGLEVSAKTEAIAINDRDEVCGLVLESGRTLPADFIVMAVGVMPNTSLAKDSGLDVNRGIVVDNCMHTSCPHVYAIGECVELDGELFGMIAPVNQQVDTLVTVLKEAVISSPVIAADNTKSLQKHWKPFVSKPLSLKLKVSGVAAYSAGQIAFDDGDAETIETLVYRQPTLNHYHCLYLKNNRLVGAVLYGDVNDGSFYSQLITDNVDVSGIKDHLIFGSAYCDLDVLAMSNVSTDSTSDDVDMTELVEEAS